MSINNFNRTKFRKIYGYDRFPPRRDSIIVENGISQSLDGNRFIVHRDWFYINQLNSASSPPPIPPVTPGEYEEQLVVFLGEEGFSPTFATPFSGTPIVTLEVQPAGGYENIIPYLQLVNSTGFTMGLSAPFSGSVKYRAIYSQDGYPTVVERNPLSPGLFYTASAGFVDVTGESYFTCSFDSLGSTPTEAFFTTFDVNSNGDVDVSGSDIQINTTDFTGELTSGLVNRINFMVVKP